jgi:hypothetical protein
MTDPRWIGPITDADELNKLARPGTVSIDDVGTMRQFRYSDSYMSAGWTQYGCGPLTSVELLERPAWVLDPGTPHVAEVTA